MSDGFVPPDVTVRGPGEPELAVVGGVHGDEPGGVRAVRRLRAAPLDLERGVAFVVAHPAAVAAGRRYLDSDLNRQFPGDPTGDREQRLAARLCERIGPLTALSIHGTRSQPTPFAFAHRSEPAEFDLAAELPVPHVVDHTGVTEGTVTTCGTVVEAEVGPQGTDAAADSAEHLARAFLRRRGALPDDHPDTACDFYRMVDTVPKPAGDSHEVYVSNFERVAAGTAYARADGRDLVADAPFHPILFSADGYPDVFGYRGEKLGESLAEAREAVAALGAPSGRSGG
ncbi:M14 family metallopeptidase [Halosimplex halophilum]|uniref:succinylglutamate desuccinylase/aspartoacylase domain-containing protein n=1 Tax=Halosimplex halophilum TaxID=2559572 RepID=UPI00107F1AE5|nr:succinylglutamate desuccinylase/aspartoacylase family protein [Halosimplex halophilum]